MTYLPADKDRCTEAAPIGVAHLWGRCTITKWHNGHCNYEALCGEENRRNHQREIWFTHGGTRAWEGVFDHTKNDMRKLPMKFDEALEMIDTGTAVVVPCAFWEREKFGY